MRIGKFGFINNYLPYYYIEKFRLCEVVEGSPKMLARMIEDGSIDYAPVPSLYYLKNKDRLKRYKFCIASKGKVLSVLVVSNGRSLDERIAVTSDTMTSEALLKIILEEKGVKSKLVRVNSNRVSDLLRVCGSALVIGDEAIKARMIYRVIMDLGEEWYDLTGYPMVFGISASLKDVNAEDCDKLLERSISWGFENFEEVVRSAEEKFRMPREFLEEYFKALSYRLGSKEVKGLKVFEELCREYGII